MLSTHAGSGANDPRPGPELWRPRHVFINGRADMNRRFLTAWVAVFIVWMLGSFVVHGTLLQADYARLPNLFRGETDARQYFGFMILAHVVLAGAFVWIYARGVEAAPWAGQGLRFGLAVSLLTVVPTYTIYYAVQPMPASLVIRQVVFDAVVLLLLGCVAAFVYRDRELARADRVVAHGPGASTS